MSEFDLDGYMSSLNSLGNNAAYDNTDLSPLDIKPSNLAEVQADKLRNLIRTSQAKKAQLEESTVGRLGLDPDSFAGKTVNFGMTALDKASSQVLGTVRTAPSNAVDSVRERLIDRPILEAAARKDQGTATPEDLELLGRSADIIPTIQENPQSLVEGVEMLMQAPRAVPAMVTGAIDNLRGLTNQDRVDELKASRKETEEIKQAFDGINKYVYRGNTDEFDADLVSGDTPENLKAITDTFDKLVDGKDGGVSDAATKAVPAIASLIANVGSTALDNPVGAAEYVVGNLPQLAVGLLGKGALATTNIGYALDYQNKGILAYQEANDGALPTGEAANEIAIKAASLALAEHVGELGTLNVLTGAGRVTGAATDLLKNAAKRTTNLVGASAGEALTEGFQTAIEGELELNPASAEDIYKGAAIGAVTSAGLTGPKEVPGIVGEVLASGAKALGAKSKAAKGYQTPSEKAYQEAAKTGKVDSLTDVSSEAYSPDKAVQALAEFSNKEGTTPKQKAKAQADAAVILESAKKALSLVTTSAEQSTPEQQALIQTKIAEQTALVEKATTPEDKAKAEALLKTLTGLVVTPAQAKALKVEVARHTDLVAAAEVQLSDWTSGKEVKTDVAKQYALAIAELDSTIPDHASQVKTATEDLVKQATTNPSLITEQMATKLASNPHGNLSAEQQDLFTNLARMSRLKREYKDSSAVAFDILQDDPTSGNIGLLAHERGISEAIASGNQKQAIQRVADLRTFAAVHASKRKAVKEAYTEVKQSPDKNKSIQLVPAGHGVWTRTSGLTQEQLDEQNGLTIDRRSKGLVTAIANEVRLLKAGTQAANSAVTVGFSKTPVATSPAKSEVKAKPEPKDDSVGESAKTQYDTRADIIAEHKDKTAAQLKGVIARKEAKLIKSTNKDKQEFLKADLVALKELLVKAEGTTKTEEAVKEEVLDEPNYEDGSIVFDAPSDTRDDLDVDGFFDGSPQELKKATEKETNQFKELVVTLGEQQFSQAKELEATTEVVRDLLNTYDYGMDAAKLELFRQLLEGKGTLSAELVQSWMNKYATKPLQTLFSKMITSVEGQRFTGFHLRTDLAKNGTKEYRPAGMYFIEGHSVGINPAVLLGKSGKQDEKTTTFLAETVAHEVVHVISEHLLREDPEFRTATENLMTEVRAWLDKGKNASSLKGKVRNDLQYALSNPSEFLAVSLTSPDVQAVLGQIESDNGSVLSRFANALLDALKRAMKLSTADVTVLTKVVGLLDIALGEQDAQPEPLGDFDEDVATAEAALQQQVEERALSETGNFTNWIDGQPGGTRTKSDFVGKTEGVLKIFSEAAPEVVDSSNYQTTNLIAAYFKQVAERVGSATPRPLVAVKEFMSGWMSGQFSINSFLAAGATASQEVLLNHVKTIYPEWKAALESLLEREMVKNEDGTLSPATRFFYEKPMQFLMDDKGVAEENVLTAAVMGAITWVAETAGSGENRTDSQINSSLPNREKDQLVPKELRALLAPLNDRRELIADRLGQRFVQALGLQAKDGTTPINERARLETASGLMIVGLLQKMGVIEEQQVPTLSILEASGIAPKGLGAYLTQSKGNHKGNATQTLAAVKAAKPNLFAEFDTSELDALAASTPALFRQTEAYIKFVSTGTGKDYSLNTATQALVTMASGTGGVLNSLMDIEGAVVEPTLEPQKVSQKDTNKGKQKLPNVVFNYLGKIAKHAYQFRVDDMVRIARTTLTDSREFFEALAGIKDTDDSLVHVSKRASLAAKNDGLRREINHMMGYLAHLSMASENGEQASFFSMPTLWKNHRFGYAGQAVNMQSSKIHRFMVKQGNWLSVVSLNDGPEGTATLDNFKLRVLEGLGAKTDASPDADHIAGFDAELAKPVYAEAITALRSIIFGAEGKGVALTVAQREAILAAVTKGGANLHSLDALVAMAHMQEAQANGKTSFTTELTAEIDGKTNGPMLSMFLLGGINAELAEMGGFYTENSGATHYSGWKTGKNDLYQHTATAITGVLGSMANAAKDKEAVGAIFASMYNLTGQLVKEDDSVTSAGRNLVKNPLTTLVYGSGMGATVRGMADSFIESIYSSIEAINRGEKYGVNGLTGEAAYTQLTADLNNLMGAAFMQFGDTKKPGKFNYPSKPWAAPTVEAAMGTYLSPVQEKLLRQTFNNAIGKATQSVIETEFADYMAARKTVTWAANMAYALHAGAHQHLRKAALDLLLQDGPNGEAPAIAFRVINKGKPTERREPLHDLTTDQIKAIDEKLADMEPRINTVLSKKNKNGDGLQAGIYMSKQQRLVQDSKAYSGVFKFSAASGLGSKSGHGYGVYSAAPGVSVMANAVQSTDGAIMLSEVGSSGGVGVHDAKLVPISDAEQAGKDLNKQTFESLLNYSIPREVLEGLQRTIHGMVVRVKADPKNKALLEEVNSTVSDMLSKLGEADLELLAGAPLTGVLNLIDQLAHDADVKRLTLLSQLTHIDQYTIQAGSFAVTPKLRDKATAALQAVPEVGTNTLALEEAAYLDSVLNGTAQAQEALTTAQVLSEDLVVEDEGHNTQELPAVEGTLASPPIPSALNVATQNVFDVLGQQADAVTNPQLKNQLQGLIDNMVNKLQGPYQLLHQQAVADAAIDEVDLFHVSAAGGRLPFSTDLNSSGWQMGAQQSFVAEMVEMVIGESLQDDATTEVDKALVKLYDEARNNIDRHALHADAATSERMWDFVFNLQGKPVNTQYLSRFAALGLTDTTFAALLGFDTATGSEALPDTLFGKLMHWFNELLNWLNEGTGKAFGGQRADLKLQVIVNRMVELEVARKHQSEPTKVSQLKEEFEGVLDTLNEGVRGKVAKVAKSPFFTQNKNAGIKLAGLLVEQAAEHRLDETMRVLEDLYHGSHEGRLGEVAELYNEIRGTTEDNKWGRIVLMLAKLHEKTRKDAIKNTAKSVMSGFANKGKDLTKEARDAISAVLLRTDAGSLLGTFTLADIEGFLTNPSKLNTAIAAQEAKLSGKYAAYYRNQSLLTGHFLATGKAVGDNLRMNAFSIAMLDGTSRAGKVSEADGKAVAKDLDVLISLQALSFTKEADRKHVAEAMATEAARTDGNGFTFTLQLHTALTEKSRQKLFDGQERLMVKGYVPDITNPFIETRTVPMAEVDALVAAGWTDKGSVGLDAKGVGRGTQHLMVLNRGMKQRLTGTFGLTSLKAMGSSGVPHTHGAVQRITSSKQAAVNQLFKPQQLNPVKDKQTYLVPTTNPSGDTVDYRYVMNHETRQAVLDSTNTFDLLLGSLASSIYDKETTAKRNTVIVDTLHEQWTNQKSSRSNDYLTFSAKSSDPAIRESYALLPQSTRDHIKAVWGSDGMMVRKDMYNLHFGYRKAGIANIFDKSPEDRKALENILVSLVEDWFMQGPKAALRVRKAEDIWQATVTELKDFIVVKSGGVLFWNIVSNFSLLALYGVSPVDMAKHHRVAFKGAMAWQKDSAELQQLKTMKQADYTGSVKDRDHRIAELEIALKRNPVRELIEAGLMPSIVEDVDVEDDLYSYKTELAQAASKYTAYVPDAVKTTAKWVYMAHDTPLYQVLQQGTQLSDFVARYTLYQHVTTKKRNPMSKQDAMQLASDAFINYDIPSGKGLQYANDMGFVMFTKYYLRIQKVIQHAYIDNPARAIMLLMLDNYFTGVQTIADSSIWVHNGINLADGALGYPDALMEGMVTDWLGGLVK